MFKIKFHLLLIFLGAFCFATDSDSKNDAVSAEEALKRIVVERISLIQLIARPELFHKKIIQLEGYFVWQDIKRGLFLSKESSEHLFSEGLYVYSTKTTLDRFDGHYVSLIGSFDKDNKGPLNQYSGSIITILRINDL